MPRCKAKAKQTGKRCKRHASAGYDVCAMHGGKTPKGFASPHATHGRYIKLPGSLREDYERSINDPQIDDLKAEIALIDSRINEIIANLETERYGSAWDEVANARNALKRAMDSGDVQQLIDAYNYLDSTINASYDDQQSWENITKLIEQRRKLIESYRKVQLDSETVITAERAMLLVGAIVRIIQDNVTDRQQLSAISTKIALLVDANGNATTIR